MKRGRGGWIGRIVVTALVLAASGGALTAVARAATVFDVRGTYSGAACIGGTLAECQTSKQFPNSFTISNENFSDGSFTIDGGPDTGHVNGCTITTHDIEGGGYTADETYTISADGNSWSGSFTDSNGHSGPQFENRTSGGTGPCPPTTTTTTSTTSTTTSTTTSQTTTSTTTTPGGRRSSGITVRCDLIFQTASDTCTATVGDIGSPPPVTPTGNVTFSTDNGGVFSAGRTCVLTPTPLSPGVASCSVQLIPPSSGEFPQVGAAYAGDAQHAASHGHTQFIIAALSSSSCGCCPNSGPYASDVASQRRVDPLASAAKTAAEQANAFCKAALYLGSGVVTAIVAAVATGGCAGVAPELLALCQAILATGGSTASVELGLGGAWLKDAIDPPRADFRHIGKPRLGKLRLHRPSGKYASQERLLNNVIVLSARLQALLTASDVARDRASGARRAHSRTWERRQMLAIASYARSAASDSQALAAAYDRLHRLLGTTPLAGLSVSTQRMNAYLLGVAARGLSASLKRALLAAGLPKTSFSSVAQLLLHVNPRTVSPGLLDAFFSSKASTALRRDAGLLKAFAKRVARHPVATQI